MNTTENELQVKGDIADMKRKSARGAAATFVSQGLKFFITLGSQIALARMLAPAQFGLVAMAAPVLGFVAVFSDLGLQQATIQRGEITQRELTTLFWINLAVSVVFALGLMALAPAVAWFYGEPKVALLTVALAALLPLGGLSAQSLALLNRRMQFVALAKIDIVSAGIGAAAGIAAAWMGAGYWSLVIAQAGVSLSGMVLAWWFSQWRPSRPQFDKGVLSMLHFGGNLVTFNIVSYFSAYFDNIMIGVTRGPVALGVFDRAFKLILQPLSQITAPVSRIAVPMLSRLGGEDALYRAAYLRMLQLVLLLTLPGLACACVMADQVVEALLGAKWAGTAPIMAWLSIAGMFAAYSASTYWVFVSQGRGKEQMMCGFLSSGLIMVSLLAGLPWGPVGIAMSYAAFAPLVHGCFVWVATRSGPVGRRDVVKASYPMVIAVIASLAALHGLKPYLDFPALANVLVSACVSYGVTGLVLCCIPDGNRMLGGLLQLRHKLKGLAD